MKSKNEKNNRKLKTENTLHNIFLMRYKEKKKMKLNQ